MAMVAALLSDISQVDETAGECIVDGTITLSGNYPANGDILDLSQLGIASSVAPRYVEIFEVTPAPGPQSGYSFTYLPGTTIANGLVEIFNGIVQFAAGAYGAPPFAIAGFALKFRAWFPSV